MANSEEDGLITMALAVQPRQDGIFVLATVYPEADAAHPAGQVYWDSWEGGDTTMILTANDSLSCMWASPEGSAWCGSADGNIWTTAPGVQFNPANRDSALAWEAPEPERFAWRVGRLPRVPRIGLSNVSALWGTSDACLFAGTFGGPIFRWNGEDWLRTADAAATEGTIEMDGTSDSDLFAVGHKSQVLHFDGAAWVKCPLPKGFDPHTVMTGVRSVARGTAIVVDLDGHVLTGGIEGFQVVHTAAVDLRGVALLGKRTIMASSQGAFEYHDGTLTQIKAGFMANRVFQAPDRLFFIESEQEPDPRVVEFEPTSKRPWIKRVF